VCDDDLVFTRGDVVDFVRLCKRAGLDLAQPAHSAGSSCFHAITGARVLSVARMTTFVEIGPVFVVAPEWHSRVLPFPDERGMGWGLELAWRRLGDEGCRLGIVDSVTVKHEGKIGAGYNMALYKQRAKHELAAIGATDWVELQHTIAIWRPWQKTPPWTSSRT